VLAPVTVANPVVNVLYPYGEEFRSCTSGRIMYILCQDWMFVFSLGHICATVSGMKSERLVVQMEPKLKEALEQYSKTSGVPISEFVRRAIVEALKKSEMSGRLHR